MSKVLRNRLLILRQLSNGRGRVCCGQFLALMQPSDHVGVGQFLQFVCRVLIHLRDVEMPKSHPQVVLFSQDRHFLFLLIFWIRIVVFECIVLSVSLCVDSLPVGFLFRLPVLFSLCVSDSAVSPFSRCFLFAFLFFFVRKFTNRNLKDVEDHRLVCVLVQDHCGKVNRPVHNQKSAPAILGLKVSCEVVNPCGDVSRNLFCRREGRGLVPNFGALLSQGGAHGQNLVCNIVEDFRSSVGEGKEFDEGSWGVKMERSALIRSEVEIHLHERFDSREEPGVRRNFLHVGRFLPKWR
mmetsp:Transcript_8565/g.16818  ORF Transcript_8565/g.16818 Transcript_8565/m.16818 type:complete len:295 (-) Transcript_8565:505-1389(-)